MKHTILSGFDNLPYFTIAGFRQIAGDALADDAHARITLNRWVKAGYLIALKKGIYMSSRFYERHHQDSAFSPMVSAALFPHSYLSMEYVLQQHDILTEITYPVTAITARNTRTIINNLGTFVYRHIQQPLYRGFQILTAYGVPYAQASLAKAFFDYLYLRPLSGYMVSRHYNLAEELRLNLDEITREEQREFAGYVSLSGRVKMRRILKNLERYVWQP